MTRSPLAVAGADGPTVMDAFRITDRLVDSAVPAVADIATVEVSDATLHEHVALSQACDGIGFRRAAFRSVRNRGCACAYRIGETCRIPCGTPYRRSLRDMRPRVVPHIPTQARWLARDSIRAEVMHENGVHSLMVVPLVANHVVLGLVAFYRCQGSSPFRQADLRAATNLVKQTALELDAIRLDLQEQAMGRRFQRALLGQPPQLTAVEEVDGHVPVNGPPGGWFDVIPLPSARVGLVAGVCGGHGITAAAAMSQQKAQVRALAVQDTDPVEVLSRIFQPPARQFDSPDCTDDPPPAAGHCVYAVYDPVTGRCTAAHTGLAHVTVIDATGVRSVAPSTQAPIHADLCDAAEFDVPPDSLLTLSCAGVQEQPRQADGDGAGADGTGSGRDSQHPARRMTPAVTLTVRTRAVTAANIAAWDLPNEPAAVADARARTATQLTSWGLPDLSYTVTLLVSELVTNAVRYSTGPIRLRLIRDHVLTCEVADTSRAAPHAREPAPSEQSGRGLSIVAHLTQGYGTRYTATGKIVWTELAFDAQEA
ncbi:SpoIIE family protein phosphatase [Streptomyces sp. NPDC004680]|uniref:ATP-binding SpoIIE family protein phosphatase n=1 Tax=Streptomyces sp. NPDC004680 TaxID=3154287 RepID=UPI0033A2FD30